MKTHVVEVWGDLACFSRPEMKVERFSYPCMTPSAARGVLDAIYVKPGVFRWQVQRIEVLRPPRYIALRRNEVKDTVSVAKVKRWMKGDTVEPLDRGWRRHPGSRSDAAADNDAQGCALSNPCRDPAVARPRTTAGGVRRTIRAPARLRKVLFSALPRVPRVRGVFCAADRHGTGSLRSGHWVDALRRVRPLPSRIFRRCRIGQPISRFRGCRRALRSAVREPGRAEAGGDRCLSICSRTRGRET